jgi:chromosome partitioning protein
MKRVIAIANQKGGVGKTTTSVNLAASLAATRRRVLLIDLDPQGNATMGCGIDKSQLAASSCEVLLGESDLASAIIPVEQAGFMLLPANQDLTAAEVRLLALPIARETKLRQALQPKRDDFDVILIDCPPALNMLTVNALVASDSVLIPMQCEYYALEGLSALVSTIEQIRVAANPALGIEGILRTMFDPRNNLANDVSGQLIAHFGDAVFRTVIPRNIRLAEAPSFGKPVLFHDKESRGALAYLALAGEMIRREEIASGMTRAAPPPPALTPHGAEAHAGPRTPVQDPPSTPPPPHPPEHDPPLHEPPPQEPPVYDPPPDEADEVSARNGSGVHADEAAARPVEAITPTADELVKDR